GHTTMAAGIAGLLKVLLSMRYRMLPPSINFPTPNPEIDFGRSRLRPVTALEPWHPGPRGRLVGAVSSFGFSGTNAHVVVAEPPPVGPRPGATAALLVPVSAHTRPALARSLHRLAERLDAPDRPAFVDVAYTLAVGRGHLPVRAAFVAAETAELVALLRSAADRLVADHVIAGTPMLPGVVALELAADARPAPLRIASVQWLRPFEVTEPRALEVTVEPAADALRFELSGAGSCHVRGRVSTAEVTTAERLDITAVAGRCPQRRTGAGVYAAFAAAG